MSRELTIVIPQLTDDLNNFPTLKKLLRKSNVSAKSYKSFEHKLFDYFAMNDFEQLPIAAICALAEGLPAQQGCWMRADPVQLFLDASNIYLLGSDHLQLENLEVLELQSEINTVFKNDHLSFFMPATTHWYLQLTENFKLETHIPYRILGKEISHYLPRGDQQWTRLFTEIQMLLNNSIVNQKRLEKGLPMVNCLWFWGNGCLPKSLKPQNWNGIYSHQILVKGLALLNDISYVDRFGNLESCVETMSTSGKYLIVLDERCFVEELETYWFKPLLKYLRHKNFDKVIIDCANDKSYEIDVKSFQPWWQKMGLKIAD